MSKIELLNASCADQTVDAVVNAANDGLWAGGGICGVIFAKAGMRELTDACSRIRVPLNDGDAVITANAHSSDKVSGTVPAGTYLLKATCLEKATGTVRVEVLPAP